MSTEVTDELWQEFHTVVNMTSRELGEWLRLQDSGEDAEAMPGEAASGQTGRRVLEILGKRRGDLAERDKEVMERVVAVVTSQRDDQLTPTAGDAA